MLNFDFAGKFSFWATCLLTPGWERKPNRPYCPPGDSSGYVSVIANEHRRSSYTPIRLLWPFGIVPALA